MADPFPGPCRPAARQPPTSPCRPRSRGPMSPIEPEGVRGQSTTRRWRTVRLRTLLIWLAVLPTLAMGTQVTLTAERLLAQSEQLRADVEAAERIGAPSTRSWSTCRRSGRRPPPSGRATTGPRANCAPGAGPRTWRRPSSAYWRTILEVLRGGHPAARQTGRVPPARGHPQRRRRQHARLLLRGDRQGHPGVPAGVQPRGGRRTRPGEAGPWWRCSRPPRWWRARTPSWPWPGPPGN